VAITAPDFKVKLGTKETTLFNRPALRETRSDTVFEPRTHTDSHGCAGLGIEANEGNQGGTVKPQVDLNHPLFATTG
jgi:hypothetical protein